jgi:hypothetical protein
MFKYDEIAAIRGEEQACALSAFYVLFIDFLRSSPRCAVSERAPRAATVQGTGGARSGGGGVQARVRPLAGRCLAATGVVPDYLKQQIVSAALCFAIRISWSPD